MTHPHIALIESKAMYSYKKIQPLVEDFTEYFTTHTNFTYEWPKRGKLKKNYADTVAMKQKLKERWENNNEPKDTLTKEIISEWGGIKSNSVETLADYTKWASMELPPLPVKGVASYSKIYSVVQPERFVIYDARVAAALHAVQFLKQSRHPVYFHQPAGRNSLIAPFMARYKRKELSERGWFTKMPRDDSYLAYLALIHGVREHAAASGFKKPIYYYEMQLFTLAEELVQQVDKSIAQRLELSYL